MVYGRGIKARVVSRRRRKTPFLFQFLETKDSSVIRLTVPTKGFAIYGSFWRNLFPPLSMNGN